MANWSCLPEEVMVEILSRLPVESLVRFQVVHKFWYRLINHPKFKVKHLVNSLQHRNLPTSILAKRLVIANFANEENILSLLTYPVTDDRSFVDIDLLYFKDSTTLQITGHSHGIICFSDVFGDIVLCNPATREFRKLPPSILLTEPPKEFDYYDSYTGAVGFGYDPKSRDFKVVRVVHCKENVSIVSSMRVEVYNLGTDRWREIETPVNAFVFWNVSFTMYHRGICYWWANSDTNQMDIILSFDLSEEVFRHIPVPKSFQKLSPLSKTLEVFNGSIVLFHNQFTESRMCFEIWEMEMDEWGEVSWSNLLIMRCPSGIDVPLMFVNSEELLMVAVNRKMATYNVNTREFKKLPFKGDYRSFRATIFVKSLLSVKGGNKLNLEGAYEIM